MHSGVECNICHGKKVILKTLEDGITFVDCSCVAEDLRRAKIELARIPEKYLDFELRDLSEGFRKENKEDLQIVLNYLKNLSEMIKEGKGLFFQSDPGLAKSSLAAYIARQAIEQKFTCFMGRMSHFMTMKFEALRNIEASKELVNYIIKKVDLLVVEEIEKVYLAGNEDAMTEILLSEFFGELYDKKKSLIITSNAPRKDLGKLPSHILDRFDEMITDVVFTGESYRKR